MAVRALRILTFTTLYPSVVRPRHGIFVETRLAQLRRATGAQVTVVAPVPWAPGAAALLPAYALHARTPAMETRAGIPVHHPRFVNLPGAGMYTAPFALAACASRAIASIRREGFDFDVIDAHYVYPDGVAAALVARRFGRPLVLTARGSDVNVLPQFAVPRRLIGWALRRADALITVSAALAERLAALGIDRGRITVLRNGVDTALFAPMPQADARARLGWEPAPTLVSVGNLVPEKGHDLAIDALAALPGVRLVIVGEGSERAALMRRAARPDVAGRVRFEPSRTQQELAVVYAAADALVLASSREGWPNVLLEAMACGTPVVAMAVGGVPEIMGAGSHGIVLAKRGVVALVDALRSLLAAPPDRAAVRRYAEQFGWDETVRALAELLAAVADRRPVAATASLAAH